MAIRGGIHRVSRKRDKLQNTAIEAAVQNLDRKKLLQFVKRHFHGHKHKNNSKILTPGTSYLPPLIFSNDSSNMHLQRSKKSQVSILQDQFGNTAYHAKLLRKSNFRKSVDSGMKQLLLKRARMPGIGSIKHRSPFCAYGRVKLQRPPGLHDAIEAKDVNMMKRARSDAGLKIKKHEAWFAKENQHLVKLATYKTKSKNRMQVDEFINFCRPYFSEAGIDIGPDEDDLMMIFQACKLKPSHDFVLKRHFIKILTSDYAKKRFSTLCPVLRPLFKRRRPDFTTRTSFDKDFPLPQLTKKSYSDASISMKSTIRKLNTRVKFMKGFSMSDSVDKQKLLSAMNELSLELKNLKTL